MTMIALSCTAALLSQQCAAAPQLPPAPVRMIAEWEPARGAMIRWPLKVPDACVVELAEDDTLFLLVNERDEAAARAKMQALQIAPDHLQVVRCSAASEWPRDWGPHQLFDGEGRWCMVDHVFAGYPIYDRAAEGGAPQMTIETGPGDDAVSGELAAKYGAQLVPFPATLTGGNFLNDGHGTAFCTQALLDEARAHCSEAELRALLKARLGVHRLVVMENTEVTGIQHIDCWLKVLDAERLLVKRPPKGHNEEAPIERNLEKLRALKSAFGRPYQIVRIDCPRVKVREFDEHEPIAAYTNSLILNGKVLVPLYQTAGDAAAIATWQRAMPGHEVVGFPWDQWLHFDALHCRSRAVFDQDMLRLEHAPLQEQVDAGALGVAVSAWLRSLGDAQVDAESCWVFFREVGAEAWQRAPLRPVDGDVWRAALPRMRDGARVEYYLEARDTGGEVRVHPVGAPQCTHAFSVRATGR
ncbi:MAG: agmatine deiminase family protein [Planctomycetota bacterium]|nr:agmatine deiminase family protein [Planctomycetota bacterium]